MPKSAFDWSFLGNDERRNVAQAVPLSVEQRDLLAELLGSLGGDQLDQLLSHLAPDPYSLQAILRSTWFARALTSATVECRDTPAVLRPLQALACFLEWRTRDFLVDDHTPGWMDGEDTARRVNALASVLARRDMSFAFEIGNIDIDMGETFRDNSVDPMPVDALVVSTEIARRLLQGDEAARDVATEFRLARNLEPLLPAMALMSVHHPKAALIGVRRLSPERLAQPADFKPEGAEAPGPDDTLVVYYDDGTVLFSGDLNPEWLTLSLTFNPGTTRIMRPHAIGISHAAGKDPELVVTVRLLELPVGSHERNAMLDTICEVEPEMSVAV